MKNIQQAQEHFAALIEAQKSAWPPCAPRAISSTIPSLTNSSSACAAATASAPPSRTRPSACCASFWPTRWRPGAWEFKEIDGLTIENRAACGKAIPDDVLAELKACHVILKGPTTTAAPPATNGPTSRAPTWPCARRLDLFATCAR